MKKLLLSLLCFYIVQNSCSGYPLRRAKSLPAIVTESFISDSSEYGYLVKKFFDAQRNLKCKKDGVEYFKFINEEILTSQMLEAESKLFSFLNGAPKGESQIQKMIADFLKSYSDKKMNVEDKKIIFSMNHDLKKIYEVFLKNNPTLKK